MRRILRLSIAAIAGMVIGSVVVAHNALVIPNRLSPNADLAGELARATGSACASARVTADDGAALDGWVFTPRTSNGAGVILLHGVGDTRRGMLSHARFLLRAGYTVLTPDARGHGASGGQYITYGVLEARDVHAWAEWLHTRRAVRRLYGFGASMGAAVLLQSLAVEPRFRAVVAESPFTTFEEIAYDRLGQASGAGRVLLWPVVNLGFGYARVRYGVDLHSASPVYAARAASIPILLIHGDRDRNIDIRHSRAIHAANPRTTLWEVAGAAHVQVLSTVPAEYIRRVCDWFERH
jgi:dipeptidyl aminopeptidase/acylaminoacyl peptidase